MVDETPEERENRLLRNFLKREGLTPAEVKAIIKSGRVPEHKKVSVNAGGTRTRFMYVSDTHIGHKEFRPELWDRFVRSVRQFKPEFVAHPGDHLEGMSGRPGHVYELDQIGYEAQLSRAVELYSQVEAPIIGIDGNHDQWFYKKNNGGAVVGEGLESRLDNFTNLGQDEGRIELRPGVDILLFHPGDGTAYATSYKLQKLIESFRGGEKPNIVLEGHYHKALYMFSRGVHGFECGTMMGQSSWMRGKKIQAHMGFGLVDVWANKKGVTRLRHEFFPHYD